MSTSGEQFLTISLHIIVNVCLLFGADADNTQSTNGRHDSRETTGGLGTLECSPKSQNSSSVSSFKKKSNSINRPKELGGNESDSSTTKADSGLPLTRTSHELSTSSSSLDHRDHGSGHRSENGHHHGTMSTDR